MSIKITTKEFIARSKKIHKKNKYDYSKSIYTKSYSKLEIICKIHGSFFQTPNDHYDGCGCPKCSNLKLSKKYRSNKKEFILQSKKIHGNIYNYSKVKYVNAHTKVEIICKTHGSFFQKPNNHLIGKGCRKCHFDNLSKLFSFNTETFIKKANEVHNQNRYDYSLVKYKNMHTKVKIVCKKHGIFLQTPTSHLSGRGCYLCNESQGELKISYILNKFNIKYKRQKTFKECVDKKTLPFDFYLIDYNICIEYDGIQHFKTNYWNAFNITQKHDNIKNRFCEKNGIPLFRIPYTEKNKIEESIMPIIHNLREISQ